MPDIQIKISAVNDTTGLRAAKDSLDDLGKSAQNVASNVKDSGRSASEAGDRFGMFGNSLTDVASGIGILTGALSESAGLIGGMNALGVSALRANEGLDVLSGGQATSFLSAMNVSTKGLIDDLDLAKDATMALSTGLATTPAQLAEIARIGATLGTVFEGSATTGVSDFEHILERVGNTRSLVQLGIAIEPVKKEFEDLKAAGMDAATAWTTAVMDGAIPMTDKLSGTLTGTGTAVEKLTKQWDDFKASAAENVAIGLEATITLAEALADRTAQLIDQWGHTVGFAKTDLGPGINIIGNQPEGDIGTLPIQPGLNAVTGQNAFNAPSFPYWNASYKPYDVEGTNFTAPISPEGSTQPHRRGEMPPSSLTDEQIATKYKLQQQADAVQDIRDLWSEASSAAQPYIDKIVQANSAIQAQTAYLAHRNEISSLADAFGTGKQGGLFAETEGTINDTVQQARDAREAADRKKGMGKGAIDADLAGFDASAADAMQQFEIATGKTTPQLIAEQSVVKQLNQSLIDGKLPLADYRKEMYALAAAAADGATSMSDVKTLAVSFARQNQSTGYTGNFEAGWQHMGTANQQQMMGAGTAGAPKAPDPYADVNKSIATLEKGMSDLPGLTTTALAGMALSAKSFTNWADPIANGAGKARDQIGGIGTALKGLVGTLTISVGFNGSSGGSVDRYNNTSPIGSAASEFTSTGG